MMGRAINRPPTVAFQLALLARSRASQTNRSMLQEVRAGSECAGRAPHPVCWFSRADNPLLILPPWAELPVLPAHHWDNRKLCDTTFQPGLKRGPLSYLPNVARPAR